MTRKQISFQQCQRKREIVPRVQKLEKLSRLAVGNGGRRLLRYVTRVSIVEQKRRC